MINFHPKITSHNNVPKYDMKRFIASKSGVLRTKTSSLMSWVAVVLIAFVLVPWLTSVKAKHPNAFPIKEFLLGNDLPFRCTHLDLSN